MENKENKIDPYQRSRDMVEKGIRHYGEEMMKMRAHAHYLQTGLSLIGNAASKDQGIRTLSEGLYKVWISNEPNGFRDKPDNITLKDRIIDLYKEKAEANNAEVSNNQ